MKELKLGIKEEMEHKGTINRVISKCKSNKCPSVKQVARMIAKDHLKEDKKYYSKLRRCI